MRGRTTATLLGGAAVLTVAILLLVSVVLQRLPGRAAAPPATAPVSTPVGASATPTQTPAAQGAEEEGSDPDLSAPSETASRPNGVPFSRTAEARRQWEPVVVGFGTGFTRTGGRSAAIWRGGLDRYVTPAVQKQLRTVDPRNVPTGSYDGFEVDTYDEEGLAAMVTYQEGWALVVYLIHDGEKWLIYRYDRWEE